MINKQFLNVMFLVEEGMYYKLNTIPENASMRIHDILSKIVNKGKSNVIAIVL